MNWDLASHDGLPYRFALPPGYDPFNKRYPLVVYLHGSGERGTDTTSHLKNGVQALEGHQAIAVAPQCPPDDTWGGSWYGGSSPAQRKLIGLVQELTRRKSVDADRVSLIGYSMGAIGLWDVLARHRELFSAAAPIAGDLHPETARGLSDFPIWAFHGEADPLVSPANVRRVAELMRHLGGRFRYTEFAGVEHDSWRFAFATPELLPWLLSARR